MSKYDFKYLLQENGWLENVTVETDDNGIIKSINQLSSNSSENIGIPGFQNAHSHAFQYAMAGLAEYHPTTKSPDDFWSWRKSMYELALKIDPDQLEAIASMLYAEMVRHGYTHVAEFHYLHHDKKGKSFENIAEMGSRLIQAAKNAGINITLIPIFYQKGGFSKEATNEQRRFISNNIDAYMNLFEASKSLTLNEPHASIGLGIHSMRAVETDNIIKVSNFRHDHIPFHIHVSEQIKEVEDSLHYLKARPVEWLSDNISLSKDYHLVHATHLVEKEINAIANSKANVVICPSTEGNLGDGIFPLRNYLSKNGNWSIGTDSHIGINPMEEIKLLDYGQRLTTNKRNTFSNLESGDSGFNALKTALQSGRKAMGNHHNSFFEIGKPLNAVVYSSEHPLLSSCSKKNLCNTLVFASDISMLKATIVNGNYIFNDGIHKNMKTIKHEFEKALKVLKYR